MADRAVLCGINEYESISDLRGCLNDVENVHRLLVDELGFDESNVRVIRDSQVNKEAIEDGFDWLAAGVSDGERAVFHFSGHGSYIPSTNGDEDIDELICLYGMNWSDPDSYLTDDDLGALTRRVTGGRLTLIIDSCHSGTVTRAVTAAFGLARTLSPKLQLIIPQDTAAQMQGSRSNDTLRMIEQGDTALLRSFREERNRPVFARFVQPPAAFQVATVRGRVKRFGETKRTALNHQLLAGARDDQTAADAYLSGDYHGAFTYHLCETVRRLGRKSYDEVMDTTIAAVRDAGFGQVPQNEGPFGQESVFGESDYRGGADAVGVDTEPPSGGLASEVAGVVGSGLANHPLDALTNLLRVSEKLIDLATLGGRARQVRRDLPAATASCLAYVHGIGHHTRGYSSRWFEALKPHLTQPTERKEVFWSDIVNARSTSSRESAEFTAELQREIDERLRRTAQMGGGRQAGRAEASTRGSGFSWDDFARYMTVRSTRESILERFDQVMLPLLSDGRSVDIIAHSWGTVVAYEGLRRYDDRVLVGRVPNLFVVGSALSIGTVRRNLFGRVEDGRRPRAVERIINLDAAGDLVGGAIGDHFEIHREYLALDPVGCATYPFTNTAVSVSCAHSSYFKPLQTEVNRDIFARFIDGERAVV